MIARIPNASRSALLALVAFAAACSSASNEEITKSDSARLVRGRLAMDQFATLDVPSVVAQDATGRTFDAPVSANGSFALALSPGRAYRLFVTELRASGRQAAVSRILWPGRQAWVVVPPASGATSDGVPSDPASPGATTDGTGAATGGAAASSGASIDGARSNPSSSFGPVIDLGRVGLIGTVGSGAGAGATGSSGSGAEGGLTRDGAEVCVPPNQTTSECSGPRGDLKTADVPGNESTLSPPCATGGSAPPTASPPGAPQCERDKTPLFKEGRWDCVKMETPVTYFYSDKPLQVKASVEFPRGVLTQWYPSVVGSYPAAGDLLPAGGAKARVCSDVFGKMGAANGLLDWGTLDVLPRDANVEGALPPAPLDRYTWSFARQVAANPVRASSGQLEKFLFYRGVGDFSLPVRVTAQAGGELTLQNLIGDAIGPVFFLNVTPDRGAFTSAHAGITPAGTIHGAIPSLAGASEVNAYADALARSVRTALDEAGLFDDEATAMVNTWKRQWFRTPGARLLYIAPQSWTDRSIPLSIDPKPDSSKRVMVIRVEIVTPELEAADQAALRDMASPATTPKARAYFKSLGRFAEPRLRRALTLLGRPAYAEPLLAETIASNHTTHTPTAGTAPFAPDPNGPKYAGKGFVVHEWGTDTIVVGSDGSQLLGLQHEEEDLPPFVYDRKRQARRQGPKPSDPQPQ
jgi:hypothetical protein